MCTIFHMRVIFRNIVEKKYFRANWQHNKRKITISHIFPNVVYLLNLYQIFRGNGINYCIWFKRTIIKRFTILVKNILEFFSITSMTNTFAGILKNNAISYIKIRLLNCTHLNQNTSNKLLNDKLSMILKYTIWKTQLFY